MRSSGQRNEVPTRCPLEAGMATALSTLIGVGLGGLLAGHVGIVTLLDSRGVGCLAGFLVLRLLTARPIEGMAELRR